MRTQLIGTVQPNQANDFKRCAPVHELLKKLKE